MLGLSGNAMAFYNLDDIDKKPVVKEKPVKPVVAHSPIKQDKKAVVATVAKSKPVYVPTPDVKALVSKIKAKHNKKVEHVVTHKKARHVVTHKNRVQSQAPNRTAPDKR